MPSGNAANALANSIYYNGMYNSVMNSAAINVNANAVKPRPKRRTRP